MDITITPGQLHGQIHAIPSKSHVHRLFICAAFADSPTEIICPRTSEDIEATIQCLNGLGARIQKTCNGYRVFPIQHISAKAELYCAESASTLRFLLPIVGALGIEATIHMQPSLSKRPLSPLREELERCGCKILNIDANTLLCTGKLSPGAFSIRGHISSQFISGMLFAMALMEGRSHLTICDECVSKPYVGLTQQVLKLFGVDTEDFTVTGSFPFQSPKYVTAEGDWSSAAFFLAAEKLGSKITYSGLDRNSVQADRMITTLLQTLDSCSSIDITDVPDLLPILAVAAGALNGATFTNTARLQYKESDRISAVVSMLEHLGAETTVSENCLTVHPAIYRQCIIDSYNDHRIAMAAAIAATVAIGPITIQGAECVAKSYPSFWEDFRNLGGNYEQYLR